MSLKYHLLCREDKKRETEMSHKDLRPCTCPCY